jgi:hypothetical protein
MSRLKALVKEPLFHFLLIGLVLFTAFGLQQEESSDEAANRILVNVGVELGQLMFVAVILLLIAILCRIRQQWPFWIRQLPAYGIGGLSAFWVIERVSGF